MKEHLHACPRCGVDWECLAAACRAPARHACPDCFCAEVSRIASVELARASLRADGLTWSLAGVAALLMVFAASWA